MSLKRPNDDVPPPRMVLIQYRGELAAIASRRRAYIVSPTLAVRPPADPDRRFLVVMCRAFTEYAAGRIPGPFTSGLAEQFARAVLIDPFVVGAHADESDAVLAARLAVPEDQLALVRDQLARG